MSRHLVLALVATAVVAGCGGSSPNAVDPNAAEVSPPGDIPDNQAFVRYAPPGAPFTVKVPEGWSRTAAHGAVTFTDKLNSIRIESRAAAHPPKRARVTYVEKAARNPVTGKAGHRGAPEPVSRH